MTPYLEDAVAAEQLAGGTHHAVWLARQADGSRVVVKATAGAPAGMFAAEAEGLAALRASGAVAAPRVVDAGAGFLVLEALPPAPGPDDVPFWEAAGRSLAGLHAIGNDRFGWHRDNWLGPTPQINTWTDDGYEFFVQHRVLRYLTEPATVETLDAQTRAGLERICGRLPDLLPPSGAALTHGDLWPGNVLATPAGAVALIDPAVSWAWPAVDVSMMLYTGTSTPDRFFAAYHEIHPAEPGWREHMLLVHLREMLCVIAQRHPQTPLAARAILDIVARFA
ncbi:MAG: hypothetical protein V7637_2062 [Mycobacteriales bacterium]